MVSTAHRDWFYVVIPIYFLMLAATAAWAYRRMAQMNQVGDADKLANHYLGGRTFGPLLTTGTIFASVYSGYTAVGVPNEAYFLGWYALRWIPLAFCVAFGYYGTCLRFRRASMIRNHQSPVDIITDRYQSNILRYTMVFIQIVTSIIYLAAQVIAIKNAFNGMFGIDVDASWPVAIIMCIILLFEWMGGLSSVALTDGIQGLILFITFIILPIIVKVNFGGWSDLDPATYPKPYFYATPKMDGPYGQWKFFQFPFVGLSFFTLPHFIQRTYAARDIYSLKAAYSVCLLSPWLLFPVGIYLGTVGVQMLEGAQVPSPFASIIEEVMNLGGFSTFVGVLAFTASLAAIMSTADSLIIAISQLAAVEVLHPLTKSQSPRSITLVGRFVSLVAVGLALIIGIYWDSGITDLAAIQFPLALQGIPAFLFALFATSEATDIHPWILAGSAWAAMIYVLGIYFGYLRTNSDPAAIDAGVTGLLLQAGFIFSIEFTRRLNSGRDDKDRQPLVENEETQSAAADNILLYPNRPLFDVPCRRRFGDEPLTPQSMWKMMEGIEEPVTNVYHVAFIFLSISLVTPWAAGGVVTADAVVNGLPWWAFKIMILSAIPFAAGMHAVWKMPNEFPPLSDSGYDASDAQQDELQPEPVDIVHTDDYIGGAKNEGENTMPPKDQTETATEQVTLEEGEAFA